MNPEAKIQAARRQVLADWRHHDWTEAEEAWRDTTTPCRDLVQKITQKLRLDQRQSETEILRVWNLLLPESITSHAQPVALKNGTLLIHVDHPAWLEELVRFRRHEILQRLKESFGPSLIQKLQFRIG